MGKRTQDKTTNDTPPNVKVSGTALWVLGVTAVALAVRLLYLAQLSRNPDFLLPLFEAQGYTERADQWIRGRGLHPEVMDFSLLYHLFLSACFFLTDASQHFARIVHLVLGSCTCGIVSLIAFRNYGKVAGLATGLIAALYAPSFILDSELIPTVLECFWSVCLLFVVSGRQGPEMTAARRYPWGLLLGFGGLLGLRFLLIGLSVAALRPFGTRAKEPAGTQRCRPWSLLGFATPLVVALLFLHGQLFSDGTRTRLALNFYLGNSGDICRTLTMRPGPEFVRLMDDARTQADGDGSTLARHFARTAARAISQHPLAFLAGIGQKTLHVVSSRELPAALDIRASRERAHLVRPLLWQVGLVGFPFVLVITCAAIGLAFQGNRLTPATKALLAVPPLLLILSSVTAQDRLPWVLMLMPLAGAGIAAVPAIARAPGATKSRVALVCAVSAFGISCIPGPFCVEKAVGKAELYRSIGQYYLQQYRVVQARGYFERALESDSTDPQAWNGLGICNQLEGRIKEARSSFSKAIELDSAYTHAFMNLASTEAQLGNIKEAIATFERGLTLQPSNGKAHNDLGLLYLRQGNGTLAAESFRKARTLNPNVIEPRIHLSEALVSVGEFDAAEAELVQALNIDPLNARTHTSLGVLLLRKGDAASAEGHLLSARNLAPSLAESHYGLAALYLSEGKDVDAYRCYTNGLAADGGKGLGMLTVEERGRLGAMN